MQIGVLGAGTWGCALANLLVENGQAVTVWSALPDEVRFLQENRRHPKMQDPLSAEIVFTNELQTAFDGTEVIVMAVPSVYVKDVLDKAGRFYTGQHLVSVVKGIDAQTLKTFSQIIDDALQPPKPTTVLTGPTHAEEVICRLPTTIVAANKDLEEAKLIQQIFTNTYFRVYTAIDAVGSELCGALKNIIALAAGIADGIGYGDNAKAALITRGITEIARLGSAMGARPETFGNLAGIGDLIVTCTSSHSRNHNAGYWIGQGCSVQEAIEKVGMVVEGFNALPAAVALAEYYKVELPIIFEIQKIQEGKNPVESAADLMSRDYQMII